MTASEQPDQAAQWVALARIRRPQGRKGEVFADILTDFPEKFAERRQLWLLSDPDSPRPKSPLAPTPRQVELIAHWLHKGGIVLHFSGVDSISAAETLAGLNVAIPRADRAPLAEDEVYIADLVGCTLYDVAKSDAPVLVGQIEDVNRTAGPVALLAVRSATSAEEILVPFAKTYLRTIDLAAKRVEMALPEGLTDLNATGKS
ncbi:MAG: ribosome maturation factor RimM [Terracidiphilus sp.]